jgi:hypothetical protein
MARSQVVSYSVTRKQEAVTGAETAFGRYGPLAGRTRDAKTSSFVRERCAIRSQQFAGTVTRLYGRKTIPQHRHDQAVFWC